MRTRKKPAVLTWSRAFRSLPQNATEQTSAVLTTLLFAVTIGILAIEIAAQVEGIVNKTVPEIIAECPSAESAENTNPNKTCESPAGSSSGEQRRVDVDVQKQSKALAGRLPMLSHLAVAAALIVFSVLGYYESRQRPRLKVQFFNKTFVQTIIDLTLVGLYYVLVKLTDPAPDRASAAPEALLVAAAFGLYVVWDFLNYRIDKDEFAQLALRKVPKQEVPFGYRRRVSLTLAVLLIIFALVYFCIRVKPGNATAAIVVDLILIGTLVAYRIAKTVRDKETHYRRGAATHTGNGAQSDHKVASACLRTGTSKCRRCRGGQKCPSHCHVCNGANSHVSTHELKKMLPELDCHAMCLICCVAKQGLTRGCCGDPCDAEDDTLGTDCSDIASNSYRWRHAFVADLGERHEDHFTTYFEGIHADLSCHGVECGRTPPVLAACELCRLARVRLTEFGQYIYGIISKEHGQCVDCHCPCVRRTGCCDKPACEARDQAPYGNRPHDENKGAENEKNGDA